MKKKYNWKEIQEFYNQGNSWRAISKKFGVYNKGIQRAIERGDLVTNRGISESLLIGHKNKFINKPVFTEEFKKSVSIRQSLNNTGGRCKWFDVDGQKVQGTWERDLALHMSKLGIVWKKIKLKTDVMWYKINGQTKAYTPDFYLPEYSLKLEIKGYWWGNDKEKMNIISKLYPNQITIIEKDIFFKLLETKTKEEFIGFIAKR